MVTTQKIRIRLKAYDHKLLDQSALDIVETVRRTGAKVAGPIPLPTKRHVHCIVKPTALGRASRTMEHFEMRIHRRLIDILDSTARTVDALMKLDLPGGVDIAIKTYTP